MVTQIKELGIESMKQVAVTEMVIGALWFAAHFIPVVGPFIKLTKSVIMVCRTLTNWWKGHSAYLKAKDTSLRSMFRQRDCAMLIFIKSEPHIGPTQIADETESYLHKCRRALATTGEAFYTSWEINAELKKRLFKNLVSPLRGWEGPSTHETSVMTRLMTGSWDACWYPRSFFWIFGGNDESGRYKSQPCLTPGDVFLPNTTIKPSLWVEFKISGKAKELLDEAIHRARNPIIGEASTAWLGVEKAAPTVT